MHGASEILHQVRSQKTPTLDEIDQWVATTQAASRRQEIAAETVQRYKRASGASLQEFCRHEPIRLTEEGRREAAALGLVNYKTKASGPALGRVTIEIDPLQSKSNRLRKSVITGARLHDQEARRGAFRGAWYFLTLTYREGSPSGPGDIRGLFRRMRSYFDRARRTRKRFARESFRYVWVGELTQRFKPHYHVMLWVPKGMWFGKVDNRGWWPHGSTQIEKARNCVGYLAKYASKFTSFTAGKFPKGFRTHGVGGLGQESKRELRWWKAPKEAREVLGPNADIRKIKGGWFDKLTGELWPSPWKVSFVFGRLIAWKLIPL
ncbi:YagK/YfjJ domain-containing protein [Xanthomonas campestris]|uniref:YagK/YfjJ domain-containing protein n=1 Tax=Xanthomonas campestris TaxID=339 RepID=UPI00279DA7F3|nr:inovirus-type Gp2 protein [Xanthomonas campestris pv. campestris]WDL23962.1 inovirus-type Gp2 protein [Xanthomonas campestris pv. campestris]WDL28039.1 inovirus-type Gp2 protein [Xanthomonas campestris pv. campestris]WDL32139.1 inovirus-type Gp2 protein [Xanthomonas campestris pv. campestris]WDL36222.1 inovirus-type Gp2 protein [Xanthomonas campestris pv. campestris]